MGRDDAGEIRRYRPTDRRSVADVCLRTGAGGADATGLHAHDDMLADVFALPYVDFDPDLCFVVECEGRVSGYVVATADTRTFIERYRREWMPRLKQRYGGLKPPTASSFDLLQVGLNPGRMRIAEVDHYPAHLHIDLLPEARGNGFGRRLLRALLAELRLRGVPGVHLMVSPQNENARAFYRRIGFRPLPSDAGAGSLLGLRTDAEV